MYTEKVLKHFKDPKNLGRIENADGVGRVGNIVCIPPDTFIYTNPKVKPINKISKGERVLSHNGFYSTVKKSLRRKANEEVIVIKNKLGETTLSSDHLVLAIKLLKKRRYAYTRNKKRLIEKRGWYHAEELERGDIIAYPVLKEVKDVDKISVKVKQLKYDYKSRGLPSCIKVDKNFLRLAGYYLSEGYVVDKITRVRIGFVLNSKEKDYIKDIRSLVKDIFDLKSKLTHPKKTVTEVYVNSVKLARLFKGLFGKGAENKQIPHFMMLLPPNKQKDLILGMWRGDGHFQSKRKWPRAGYATVSTQLAHQLKILLLRQGIIPSFYEEAEYEKDTVHHQKAYRIHVGGRRSLEKLTNLLGLPFENNKPVRVHSWIEDNFVFTPIREIRRENYKGKLCNLEVKETRSFLTESLCLHNCGDVMQLYIKVGKNEKGEETLQDVKFETFGCVAAIATSSVITQIAKGKTLDEVLDLNKKEIVEKLGGLPPIKMHCSVLAVDALNEAIFDYLNKNNKKIPEELKKRHEHIEKEKKMIEEKYSDWIEAEEEMMGEDKDS